MIEKVIFFVLRSKSFVPLILNQFEKIFVPFVPSLCSLCSQKSKVFALFNPLAKDDWLLDGNGKPAADSRVPIAGEDLQ
jgi:hypothetical protein